MNPTHEPSPNQSLIERMNRRRRRLWRRTKRTVRLVVGIPVVLGVVALVLTRSPIVRWVVAARIRAQTGCDLTADRMYIELDGRLIAIKPRVDIPSVPGAAGRVLSADQASVWLDWSGVLSGRVTPIAVNLDKPIFLLSQSMSSDELNIAAIGGTAGAVSSSSIPPEVTINDGVIRFAEHDAQGTVSVLKDIHASGALLPIRGGDNPLFAVGMTQTVPGAPGPGMMLDGQIDIASGTSRLHLRNLSFDDWPAESVPAAYREVWSRMGVNGRISRIDMIATRTHGVAVEITVDGVSMSALVPAQADAHGAGTPDALGLTGVRGVIRIARSGVRAQLEGQLDGQQGLSTVRLLTQGLETTSPMSCEIRGTRIKVTKDPAFLSYVPKTVKEYFQYFSGPTADVDVHAVIARPSPTNGVPAELSVTGTLNFRNGEAAFHKFPYPFKQMEGSVNFDENRLVISKISGRGPTGASMQAHGVIGPLSDEAQVDLTIAVQRVNIDDHLLNAMPEDRARAVRAVFNNDQYQRLLALNQIRQPNRPGLDGTRSAPPCPLGGEGEITIRIERQLGHESLWATTVDARFRELGVLSEAFPMPLIGRDVRLRITDTEASITDGEFAGPRGGRAVVSANVVFFEHGKKVVKPSLSLVADGVPVDDLLLHAVRRAGGELHAPSPSDAPASDRAALTGEALDRVNLSGNVDCVANVQAVIPSGADADTTKPSLDYDIAVDVAGLRALPMNNEQPAGLAISECQGVVRLTPQSVRVEDVQARLVRTTGLVGPSAPDDVTGPVLPARDADAGHVAVTLDAALESSQSPGGLVASVRIDGLTLSDPIEDVVRVVSPSAAIWLGTQRNQLAPTGSIDIVVDALRSAGSPAVDQAPGLSVRLARVHDVEFDALDGRVGVDLADGSAHMSIPPTGPATLAARGVRARLTFNGAHAGDASIDGDLTLDTNTSRLVQPSTANASFHAWRFESPMLAPALASVGGSDARNWYDQFAPIGEFDATLQLDAPAETSPPATASSPASLNVRGSVTPRTLSILRRDRRIDFSSLEGQVRFASGSGDQGFIANLDRIVARTSAWTAEIDGRFSGDNPAHAEAALNLDLSMGVRASSVDDALMSLVPASVLQSMHEMDVHINGPVCLSNATLTGPIDDPHTPLVFDGTIDFADASLDAGVAFRRMSGQIVLHAKAHGNAPNAPPDAVRLALFSPSLAVAGLSLTDLQLDARTGEHPGQILIEQFTAACHGGRIVGHAALAPVQLDPAVASRKAYQFDAVAAGVAFAPLLEELSALGAAEPLVGPLPDETRDPDVSRGKLDARLALSGLADDAESRIGRAAVRISRGDVLRLPVIFPLMQLSNLVLPSEETLRGLEAQCVITGTTASFDRVIATGNTIALEGSGVLDLPSKAIDFRFNSKNINPIPILSQVWEAFRNELVSMHMTGTLNDPKVGSESFVGIRRMFARHGDSAERMTSDAINSSALADIARFRASTRPVASPIPSIAPDLLARYSDEARATHDE